MNEREVGSCFQILGRKLEIPAVIFLRLIEHSALKRNMGEPEKRLWILRVLIEDAGEVLDCLHQDSGVFAPQSLFHQSVCKKEKGFGCRICARLRFKLL